ncbi:LysR family transcriptional regulator [Comamonas sp. 4034]|uniref:LysR family transcriptional regulator n=1 Tax=Comamonas sp. 4034 TaxID=3156455 RepID=UPI00320BD411
MTDAEPPRKSAPTPSLRQLSCFKEVANHRSFSRAAQALSMSQPALSSAIRELENLLGTPLFDRSTHHVRMTPAGEAVRPQVEWMINNFVQGVQDLQQLLKYQADTVRVSCIPSAIHLLAPWLAIWQKENPMVDLQLQDLRNEDLLHSVANGGSDIGLGLEFTVPSTVDTQFVTEDEVMAVMPASHRLAKMPELRWTDLNDEPLVILSRGSTYEMIVSVLEQQGVGISHTETLTYTESLYALVRSGLRIGLISRLYTQCHVDNDLVTMPLKAPLLSRRICLMTRSAHGNRRPVVQQCWDYLCSNMGSSVPSPKTSKRGHGL